MGDTSWIVSGPGHPGSQDSVARVRAVAFWNGDSTLYRLYVATSGPLIAFCQRIANAAAIPGVTPRNLTGEESLAVWKIRR